MQLQGQRLPAQSLGEGHSRQDRGGRSGLRRRPSRAQEPGEDRALGLRGLRVFPGDCRGDLGAAPGADQLDEAEPEPLGQMRADFVRAKLALTDAGVTL